MLEVDSGITKLCITKCLVIVNYLNPRLGLSIFQGDFFFVSVLIIPINQGRSFWNDTCCLLLKGLDDWWVNIYKHTAIIAYERGKWLLKIQAFLGSFFQTRVFGCVCMCVLFSQIYEYISTLQPSGEMLSSMSYKKYSLKIVLFVTSFRILVSNAFKLMLCQI